MPKQILKSVGRAGVNFSREDVMTVQYLLNCVPVQHGGPPLELEIDGFCGPKTIKAIEDFQKRWFSFVDGKVDPNGQTIGALRTFDPAPHQPLPPPGASDIKNAGNSPAGSKTGGPAGKTGGAGGKTGGGGAKTGSGGKTGAGAKETFASPGAKDTFAQPGAKDAFGFKAG